MMNQQKTVNQSKASHDDPSAEKQDSD